MSIDLAPVLLGEGIRLFDKVGTDPRELEVGAVSGEVNVTHITYRSAE